MRAAHALALHRMEVRQSSAAPPSVTKIAEAIAAGCDDRGALPACGHCKLARRREGYWPEAAPFSWSRA